MTRFIASLQTPVFDEREAAVIDWALRAAASRVRAAGGVTYHHGEFLPVERRFLAWFNADNDSLVRQVAETAQLAGIVVREIIALDEGLDAADSFERTA